jgi:hypothetical protein
MVLTRNWGNEVALMDTLRRASALRNTAAGQLPDETRHAGFVPAGDASRRLYSSDVVGVFGPVLVQLPYFLNNTGIANCSHLTYRRGHLCPIPELRCS